MTYKKERLLGRRGWGVRGEGARPLPRELVLKHSVLEPISNGINVCISI